MSQYDNQDYYKVGGRSIGPAGPLDAFKREVSKSRSVLGRDQERVLPGERPRAGLKPGAPKGGKKSAAVGQLPRVPGTAGMPSRAKPTPTLTKEEAEDARRGQRAMAEAEYLTGYEDVASPTPSEAGEPVPPPGSAAKATGAARPETPSESAYDTEPQVPEVPAWLLPALRPFRPALRLLGGAARILDPPVRYTLETMQRIGRLAEAGAGAGAGGNRGGR
jgi:hypothetical protein